MLGNQGELECCRGDNWPCPQQGHRGKAKGDRGQGHLLCGLGRSVGWEVGSATSLYGQVLVCLAKSSSFSQPRCSSKMGHFPLPSLPVAQLLIPCSSLEPVGFHPGDLPGLCLYSLGHSPSSLLLSYHKCHFVN